MHHMGHKMGHIESQVTGNTNPGDSYLSGSSMQTFSPQLPIPAPSRHVFIHW